MIKKILSVFDYNITYYDFGDIHNHNAVYIQGMLHSNEVNSYLVLHHLVEFLQNNPPKIPLRIVPACNPCGWRMHSFGCDGRVSFPEYVDWNRIFFTERPSNSIEFKMSNALMDLSQGFKRVIDIHTPECGYPHVYTTNIISRLNTFDDLPYVISPHELSHAFEDSCAINRHQLANTLEVPSIDDFRFQDIQYWVKRIAEEINSYADKNYKSEQKSERTLSFGIMKNYYSEIEGVSYLLVEPNHAYPPYTQILEIISPNNKQVIISDCDCIPLCFRKNKLVPAGVWAMRVLQLSHKAFMS